MATIGQQLSDLIDQENSLLDATTDARERDKIRARIEDQGEQLEELIDRSWDQTAASYKAASDQLGQAVDAVNKARKGLQSLDNALTFVDNAVDALAGMIKFA